MNNPPAPCAAHERRANPDETETSQTPADVARPTHRLRNIRCGDDSAQLLVSTRDHVYDAEDVQAGVGSWQVIGGWTDESAPHLTQALSHRSSTASSNRPATRAQPSTQSHFERSGQKLGTGPARNEGASGSMSGNGLGYK